MALSASRCRKNVIRNIKDEIILEVSKVTICTHMKMKDKTVYSTKEKYLTANQALARRDRKLLSKGDSS